MVEAITCFIRPILDSVAALVHDVRGASLVMTEQFRYPTWRSGPGWLTEVVAGMVDAGELPVDTITREIEEEVGYRVAAVRPIGSFFVSPGGSSERIHLYYAAIERGDRVSKGGGQAAEGEDIRVLKIPVEQALQALQEGQVVDAKTIIALQWLALNRGSM